MPIPAHLLHRLHKSKSVESNRYAWLEVLPEDTLPAVDPPMCLKQGCVQHTADTPAEYAGSLLAELQNPSTIPSSPRVALGPVNNEGWWEDRLPPREFHSYSFTVESWEKT